MADDAVLRGVGFRALVFLNEVERAGEGDLADVFHDLFLRHADAVVDDGDRRGVLVKLHPDLLGGEIDVRLSEGAEPAQFRDRVAGVGDDLAQKDFLFGIQPFLDDGEDMLELDRDSSPLGGLFVFVHDGIILLFFIDFLKNIIVLPPPLVKACMGNVSKG